MKKRSPTYLVEDYPLNTKVEVCLEKNFSSMHCTVRKVNILNVDQDASEVKVKQVNLEVKLHSNFNEGTEVWSKMREYIFILLFVIYKKLIVFLYKHERRTKQALSKTCKYFCSGLFP